MTTNLTKPMKDQLWEEELRVRRDEKKLKAIEMGKQKLGKPEGMTVYYFVRGSGCSKHNLQIKRKERRILIPVSLFYLDDPIN